MRTKFKQWAVDYIDESVSSLKIDDTQKILEFINEKPTYLEIGPGKGKFIMDLAKKYPDYNFLVVELNRTVAGICLKILILVKLKM